jgi:outer membrane protein assembly factor BamB
LAGSLAAAGDWPQWRGPDRSGVSQETGLLKAWPDGGPKLLWTFKDAGLGYSGPAVVGDLVYTMGAEDKTEFVLAFNGPTHKKLWSTPVGPLFAEGHGDGPRATPTVDGDFVYGLGGQGGLICVLAATGEKLWAKRLKEDLGGEMMSGWGYSESPLVDGDQVVCTPGGPKGTLAALDRKTGDVLWRSKDLTDKAAYSSLVVAHLGGVRQYVVLTGDSVAGVAAADGRLLWRHARKGRTAAVPTPVCSDDCVYVTSGYDAGCSLLRVLGDGKEFVCKEVDKNKNMTNHHGGVVLTGDHVYGYDDNEGLVCQNFRTLEMSWKKPSDHGKQSLTCADGRLYCFGAKDGVAQLVEAAPTGYKVDGELTLPCASKRRSKGGACWTHPVVANGALYLRDQELIFCYDVREGP